MKSITLERQEDTDKSVYNSIVHDRKNGPNETKPGNKVPVQKVWIHNVGHSHKGELYGMDTDEPAECVSMWTNSRNNVDSKKQVIEE